MSTIFISTILPLSILLVQTSGLNECPGELRWHKQKHWSSRKCCALVNCKPGLGAVPCHFGTQSICRRCNKTDYQNTSCASTNQFCICHVRRECEPGKLVREGDTTRENECSTGVPNGHLGMLEFVPTQATTQKEWNSIFYTDPSTLARPTTTLSTTTSFPTPNELPWGIVVVAVLSALVVAGLIVIAVICWKSRRECESPSSNGRPTHVVINNNNYASRNNNYDGRNNNEVERPLNYELQVDD